MGNKKKSTITSNIRKYIPKIVSEEIDGFNYYFWGKLPNNLKVEEGNISEGDIVYRAQDLHGKDKISSKFEYTFIKFEDGYAVIRQSKYYHENVVRKEELCRKDESPYARRKRIEELELKGELFFEPDENLTKQINKRLKK